MGRRLYDLAAAEDDRRFSPFCWRVRLALRHKGLTFETVPWRFTEKEAIAPSGQGRVPVLVDGERWLSDSWAIAEYLEAAYPGPSLFGGPAGKALSRFVCDWVDTILVPLLFRLIAPDIVAQIAEKDRDYFRNTREARLGRPLESLLPEREHHRAVLHDALAPLRRTLRNQACLCGDGPAWGDMAVFGALQWCRCISPFEVLSPAAPGQSDPVWTWRERMLDAYGGEGRRTPAAVA